MVHSVYHDDPFKYNTFESPEAIMIKTEEAPLEFKRDGANSVFTYEFPPHSISGFVIDRKKD